MRVRIEPRRKTDRRGYLCMPLKENVPHPKSKSWKLTTCKGCGRECWDRPYQGHQQPDRLRRGSTPQERTRAKVYATGNKWAIENFNDTHN